MDFSTLLSSESLLYVGLGVIVLLVIVLASFLFKGKPAAAPTPVTASINVAATTATQAVTQQAEVLPSTEVVNQMPVVEQAQTLPTNEAPKAAVPPLSSWKPSQEAAPLPANDDSSAASTTVAESVAGTTSQ
jgi:hypothetical protein